MEPIGFLMAIVYVGVFTTWLTKANMNPLDAVVFSVTCLMIAVVTGMFLLRLFDPLVGLLMELCWGR